MERDRIVIRCHLVFLRVCVSGPYSSVPMPASCSRSSSCTCPMLTHSLTILSFIFPSTQNSLSQAEAVHAVEQCICAIRAWMLAGKLKLNENKTEVMFIRTCQQLSKVNLTTLTVGDTIVATVDNVQNLEVWFGSQLNFTIHITKSFVQECPNTNLGTGNWMPRLL